MKNRLERRFTTAFIADNTAKNNPAFRIKRSVDSGNTRTIRGYASVFNQKSKIIYEFVGGNVNEYRMFYEIISPGAFDDLIANNWNGIDVVLNINHEYDEILARVANNSLRLGKDERGLIYEARMLETFRGEDVLQNVKAGTYYESSFAFTVAEDVWEYDKTEGIWIRTVLKIDLLQDVAVCTWFGAYSNTDIKVADRTLRQKMQEQEMETDNPAGDPVGSTPDETGVIDDSYLVELELDTDRLITKNI